MLSLTLHIRGTSVPAATRRIDVQISVDHHHDGASLQGYPLEPQSFPPCDDDPQGPHGPKSKYLDVLGFVASLVGTMLIVPVTVCVFAFLAPTPLPPDHVLPDAQQAVDNVLFRLGYVAKDDNNPDSECALDDVDTNDVDVIHNVSPGDRLPPHD